MDPDVSYGHKQAALQAAIDQGFNIILNRIAAKDRQRYALTKKDFWYSWKSI